MATTKFGFRQWGSHGDLRCEYWISDIDLAGRDKPHAGSATDELDFSGLKFTLGNLTSIHNNNHHYSTPRSNSHSYWSNHDRQLPSRNFDPDSVYRLQTDGAHATAKAPGWRTVFFKPRKTERHDSFQPSVPPSPRPRSNSPSDTSTHSMTADVKTRPTLPPSMASTPVSEKRRSGILGRLHIGHHRRRSSVNGFANADVGPQSPQARPPAAVRQASHHPTPSQPLNNNSNNTTGDTWQPPAGTRMSNGTDDAPPQIMVRAPTTRNEFEGVHYPDGLSPSPTPLRSPGARSNKGIKWAENYDDAPPRPRRTSSAATHGRRSSIYSKDVDGNFDNVLGVETGVGSKARRLSVALPDDLQVDECLLEEHFSVLQRFKNKEIGQGGAAVVKLMQSKTAGDSSDKVYAVKEFRPRDAAEETEFDYERKIKSEFAISKACDGSNHIVKTFRLCHSGDQWYHVMEYCELGDLNDLIQSGNFQNPVDRHCMFKQLVRGVEYLHSRGIAHRDLKSENLLVNKQGCLKIADFGTGEVFSGQHPGVRNCRRQSIVDPKEPIRLCQPGWVGSVPYMAPEIYQRLGKYDPRAVDVWAVAIVYITLCFNGNCWDFAGPECKNFRIFTQYWKQFFEEFEDHEIQEGRKVPQFAHIGNLRKLDDEIKVMLMGMLHPEPAKRWTIKDVIQCKMVDLAECCQQAGYSDDIKTRQKKALHNHIPVEKRKKVKP